MSQQIENGQITFEKETQIYPYEGDPTFLDFKLKKHIELPQDGFWKNPHLSEDSEYCEAILTDGSSISLCYIWKVTNPESPYIFKDTDILYFAFNTNCKTFIIVYKTRGPIQYNIKTGHVMCELNLYGYEIKKCYNSSFSKEGRYFILATDTAIFLWDTLKRKDRNILSIYKDESPMKFIRNNYLITVNKNEIKRHEISDGEIKDCDKKAELQKVNNHTDILGCMLEEDSNNNFYYATKEGVFVCSINENDCEHVLDFKGENVETVIFNNNCSEYFTTNYTSLNFWTREYQKEMTNASIPRQKFNYININFKLNHVILINDSGILIQNYKKYLSNEESNMKEYDILKIWTTPNQKQIYSVQFTPDNYVIVNYTENSAGLYDPQSNRLLHKWVNNTPFWYRTMKIAPIKTGLPLLALKTDERLIELWHYHYGIPLITLENFDIYDIKFHPTEKFIYAGTTKGKEVARIWDINFSKKPIQFFTPDELPNVNTCVALSEDKQKLFTLSDNQNALLFDVSTQELTYQFDLDDNSIITSINNLIFSDSTNLLFANGSMQDGNFKGYILNCNDGILASKLDNCYYLEMANSRLGLLNDNLGDNNVQNNYLSYWNLNSEETEGKIEPKNIGPIDSQKYHFLKNSEGFVIKIDSDNTKIFSVINKDPQQICLVKLQQQNEQAMEADVDVDGNNLVIKRVTIDN